MDQINLIKAILEKMSFKIIHVANKNNNGPDIVATRKGSAFNFEIKKARKLASGCFQVAPVEPNRKKDHFICVEFPSGYILVEPMKDHLKNCTAKGYRSFSGIN